jgi:serine/threonine protein kinase
LDRQVAVKEYFPLEFSVRNRDLSIQAASAESLETHMACLERFLTEARTLAKLNHPNIVRVYNVFEENKTAYMAMEYEKGESLSALIRGHKIQEESRILRILHPMLDALEYIHARGFIHRDIKPSNIYIHQDDSPVLLDFGSTRVTPKQDSDTLTQLVSQGYAPHEQYGGGAGRQGQWTDIYAFGATLYALVCNRSPVNALERVSANYSGSKDPLTPASVLGAKRFSAQLLYAIDKAMQVVPTDRPESIETLRKLFPSLNQTPTTNPSIKSPSRESIATQSNRPPPVETETFITLRSEIRDYSNSGNRKRRSKKNNSILNTGITRLLSILAVAIAVSILIWFWIKKPASIADEKETQSISEINETPAIEAETGMASKPSTASVRDRPPSNKKSNFRDTLSSGLKGPELLLISKKLLRKDALISDGDTPPSKAFFLGRYEVTFAEYEQFSNATNRQLPTDSGWGRDSRPIMNVSWHDANAYTQWLSDETGQHYRLPSEAEWNFAASSGTQTSYWWGDNIGEGKANCNGCGSEWDNNKTAPVGSFKPNFFGLYDTAGNVWEWVQDCSDNTKTYTDEMAMVQNSYIAMSASGLRETYSRSTNDPAYEPLIAAAISAA